MFISRTPPPAKSNKPKKNTFPFTMGHVATLGGGMLHGFNFYPDSSLICSFNADGVISVRMNVVRVIPSFGIHQCD